MGFVISFFKYPTRDQIVGFFCFLFKGLSAWPPHGTRMLHEENWLSGWRIGGPPHLGGSKGKSPKGGHPLEEMLFCPPHSHGHNQALSGHCRRVGVEAKLQQSNPNFLFFHDCLFNWVLEKNRCDMLPTLWDCKEGCCLLKTGKVELFPSQICPSIGHLLPFCLCPRHLYPI